MTVKRYKVKYSVNWEIIEEDFSCIMNINPEVELNTELNDRYYWENREIISFEEIEEPLYY